MVEDLKDRQKEEMKLWRRYKSGDREALGTLLKSYEPVVRHWTGKLGTSPLPPIFIETEVKKQVLDSFKSFDPGRGVQLNTYVNSRLPKVLRNTVYSYSNLGKMPEERVRKISTYQESKERLKERLRRPPTAMEIADDLTWNLREVERMEKEMRPARLMTEEGEFSFVSDDGDQKLLQYVYHSLPVKHQYLMEHTFGWAGKERLGDREMAKELGVEIPEIKDLRKDLADKLEKALQLKV